MMAAIRKNHDDHENLRSTLRFSTMTDQKPHHIALGEDSLAKTTTTINLGPTHPATHGVFQNIMEIDGDRGGAGDADDAAGGVYPPGFGEDRGAPAVLPDPAADRSSELLFLADQQH